MPPYSAASSLLLLVATLATLGLLLAVGMLTRFGATNWRWLVYAGLVICSLMWPSFASQLPETISLSVSVVLEVSAGAFVYAATCQTFWTQPRRWVFLVASLLTAVTLWFTAVDPEPVLLNELYAVVMILLLGMSALVLLRYREAGIRAITATSGSLLMLAVAAYVNRFVQLVFADNATGADADRSVAVVRVAVLVCNLWIPVMVLAVYHRRVESKLSEDWASAEDTSAHLLASSWGDSDTGAASRARIEGVLRSEVKCMAFSAAPVSVLLVTLDRPALPYTDHAIERAVLREVGRRLLHEFAPIALVRGDPDSVWTDWDSVGRWAHGLIHGHLAGGRPTRL
ncbi:MAG: hypothetical protein QG597_4575 [Actinomycetota bacterium]|nr:hypothetical protein [Actinomycetota bacterium]